MIVFRDETKKFVFQIDRLYGWESNPRKDIRQLLKSQATSPQLEFKERLQKTVAEFAEQVA